VILLITSSIVAAGCGGVPSTAKQEEKIQQETLQKGLDQVPPYRPEYFQSRQTINRYMERVDVPFKEWYCYLVADTGTIFGYFIFDAYPLSIGIGMTNPMQVDEHNDLVYPAPGIDGVYWAGADPSVHYSFDVLSGALTQWNVKYIMSDQPLNIDAPLFGVIKVHVEPEE